MGLAGAGRHEMRAIGSGSLPTHGVRRPQPFGAAGLATAALAVLSLVLPVAARADDKVQVSTLTAAARSTTDVSPYRLGMTPPRVDLDGDLKLLLVQHRPAASKSDAAAAGEDTLLVAMALAVPQSVDDDIARQYGLVLLDRTELPELGLRIVQFRVSGNTAPLMVLAELHKDPRIRRAQRNVQYREPHGVPPSGKPPTAMSRPNPPAMQARLSPARSRPDRATPAVAKVADRTGADRIGDVLSGGL